MVFSRALEPVETPDRDALTAAMVGIGMEFAAPAAADPNIEDTLVFASAEAMDTRFAGSGLRVPANLLRDRPGDIAPPEVLARRHRAYRWRITMGPSYRADCWAALDDDPGLSAAALARRAYASFATAWQVKRDFAIVRRPQHSGALRVAAVAPSISERPVSRSRSRR